MRTTPFFRNIETRNFDLVIVNDLMNVTEKFRMGPLNVKSIAIHHGIRINPTILDVNTIRAYWKYGTTGSSARRIYRLMQRLPSREIAELAHLFWRLIRLTRFLSKNEWKRRSVIRDINYDTDFVNRVVSVDKESLKYLHPLKRRKWKVIYNFVALDLFNPEMKTQRASGTTNILVPRNLAFSRGVFILPELACLLKKWNYRNFRFLATGEGSLRTYLETEIEKKNLKENIVLLGHQDHFKEMPQLYANSDIVLVPSFSSEGTSLAVLEGMASKKPVVTTNVGGINDIGINEVHKLSSPFNIKKIGENLSRLMKDRELAKRIAEEGHRYVRQNHNIQVWTKKWRETITETLQN